MESGDSEREEREGVKNEENVKTRIIITLFALLTILTTQDF